MLNVYLENRGSSDGVQNNKFYRVQDDGARVVFTWGPIGSAGKSKVALESTNDAERAAFAQSKIAAQVKGHYVVIELNGLKVESRPPSDGRKWGLEVEVHSNVDVAEIAEKMTKRGLEVNCREDDYFKSDGRAWDIKRDGSCGYEFASRILSGKAGIFEAQVAVEKIREVCPTAVNSNCGIHVTIDVADHAPADLVRLVLGYLKAQEHFYARCNKSRQSNRYCQRNPVGQIERILAIHSLRSARTDNAETALRLAGGFENHSDRYHGMNWTRVFSRKVVEFRMLESSVSIRKVGAWIELCVNFVENLKKSAAKFDSIADMSEAEFEQLTK